MSPRRTLALASLAFAAAVPLVAQTPIRITADFTDAPRKLYHAEIDLPVKAGHNVFTTPKWIPGNHRPTGPAENIVGVVFTANGQTLPWRRDDVDLYEFHVDVPAGVTTLHAHLDCIESEHLSDHLAMLEWEKLLLYPAHKPVREIPVQPTVVVPKGWGVGTALAPVTPYDPNTKPGGVIPFQTTNVEQLEDSPVLAGEYFHEFTLAPDVTTKHFLDVASDEPEDFMLTPATVSQVSNLVREATTAYNSHHYGEYHFLLTLSDAAGGEGLEHGQSSDNGVGENSFSNPVQKVAVADLLAHEFTHSWNGKYRRPDKLYQPDFATVQQGELLWVYEGMTQYLGNVLAARSGLKNQEQYRDMLAMSAANLEYKAGRTWRSTDDTAVAAAILRGRDQTWANYRRGQDYYQEGELLWLDADTLIREMTGDKKSLTDFLQIFLAKGGNTGPLIVPYTREEIIHDLNQVVKYDWAKFLHDRVDLVNAHADVAGIERGGYKLVFTDKPNPTDRSFTALRGGPSFWYSVGVSVRKDGTLSDVRWGGAADKAKLAPGQKIIAVNGQVYDAGALLAAIGKAKGAGEPIHLLVQSQSTIRPVELEYHDGQKYPSLVRDEAKKDLLDEITTPLTKAPDAK